MSRLTHVEKPNKELLVELFNELMKIEEAGGDVQINIYKNDGTTSVDEDSRKHDWGIKGPVIDALSINIEARWRRKI